jgi:MFS family permease
MLRLSRYQWMVLLAAWLGWSFDIFDSLLFNFVAPNCIPDLLHLVPGSAAARDATFSWTGLLTSLLLLGWAAGGVLFGFICDRLGRMRTLMLTMVLYAIGTTLCAFAPNLWVLMLFRVMASLGIGGEWAAGASLVAEIMPEKRRVEAGALLYTGAPFGLFLANFINHQIAGVWFVNEPEHSWRYLFLFGLLPAAATLVVRMFVREPERWQGVRERGAVKLREIFQGGLLRVTALGTLVAVIALIAWWSSNAFLPTLATGLAREAAQARGLDASATLALIEAWKRDATTYFNMGGLIGTLLVIPAARYMSRRALFACYFAGSAAAIFITYGLDWAPETRLALFFFSGITVYGVFGAFPFYLTELYPTRVRATGSGFCYNIGRVLAAVGPFAVGNLSRNGHAFDAIFYVGFVPLVGLLLSPLFIETRHRALAD